LKLKNIAHLLGLRPKPRRYSYSVGSFQLGDGTVARYAQWGHPAESRKAITREMVDGFRGVLNEGDFCLDIGAHSGDTALPMAIAVGKAGCVLALEPNPFVYHVLEKNARANRGIANLQTMFAAAANDEGFLEFEYSDAGFCNGGRHEGISVFRHGHVFKQSVFCVNLAEELRDSYSDWLPRLRLIKVDTEGFDLSVLKSLTDVIRKYRPVIKTEVFQRTDRQYRLELLDFFTRLGYEVHKIIEEPLEPGPRITVDNLLEWRHYDVLATPLDVPAGQVG
jgi:FkbM family methyltransferase